MAAVDPGRECFAPLRGDLELDGARGLLLDEAGSCRFLGAMGNVSNVEANQVASPQQLAVDGEIEESQLADVPSQLQPDPDGPDLLELGRGLLADELAAVPGGASD